MTWADAIAPLRNRNFAWYFASRFVNTLGNMMASIALAFAVLDITDSPTALGQVLAAHTIPMVALLLYGGVIADRFPRTLVLQFSNFASAISQGAIALLVLGGHAEIWMLVVLSVVHGAVSGIGFPAMASVLPQLVPREHLQPANALISLTRNGMAVLGPTIGALLVVTVGSGWALAVDAATWLLAALLLLPVALPPKEPSKARPDTVRELREGWTFFWSVPWLWAVVVGFGALNFIHAGAWSTLGPAVADDTIGRQAWGYVLSAEAVGLLVTTVVLLRVRLERPLLLGMIGVSMMAPPMLVLGASPHLVGLIVVAFVSGAGTEVFGMGWNLAMQENIDDAMLSRAYSYDALGSFVALPLGQLVYGPLALAFGFEEVLVVSAVAYVAIVALVLCSRSVRTLQRAPATPTDAVTSATD
ncbi:Predicted arabinose efflux permease, MFS family [Nocardioides exalbidus]|uniref:Predicted arabinose efflux permease, MFS family n=1 Tax=Nocardioides exalbidus TaxID=402596 RepID=A0A1H4VLP1_9ACTN|nr:MFS transporter [Nocardioides exalbidus]SEC81936.1 Predicted arabinose efflux permease, MFS family [Nocardioides exalbidus]